MTHSFHLDSGDAEQISGPWSSRLNGRDPSPLTATATGCQLRDIDSVFHNDAVDRTSDMILSPSPPPQSQQIHQQAPMQVTEPIPPDPHVASLKSIFPDFDDAVILSVLESTNNDHDRALDALLGMSDPLFVPPNPPPAELPDHFQSAPSTDAQRLSQEALDEQLARKLAFEEQQAAANEAWQPLATEGQMMYQPYRHRLARNSWGSQSQGRLQTQGQGSRDTMTEFQEGFNRIAESGKKTFSSIVSKVKAKMQEFDQGQGWSRSQNPPPNQPPQPAPASYSSSYAPGPQQGTGQSAYTYQSTQLEDPHGQTSEPLFARTSSYTSSPPRLGVSGPAATEPAQFTSTQQPSYYDPNARGYDLYGDDDEIQLNDQTTASATAAPVVATSATAQRPTTPLQADSELSRLPPSNLSSPPSYASPVSPPPNSGLPSSSPPTRSFSPTITSAKGTTPGAPGGVDFSKLGLLPKRPISLVQPHSTTGASAGSGATGGALRVVTTYSQSTTDSSTDREESEFVENPFEDPK